MKISMFSFFVLLFVFSTQSLAINTNEWVFESITGDLKPTAGCKDKEKAAKQASSGYRFNKYTSVMCNSKGYGWSKAEVKDRGELICETCEGVTGSGGEEKYRCYMKNVNVICKQVKRGL